MLFWIFAGVESYIADVILEEYFVLFHPGTTAYSAIPGRATYFVILTKRTKPCHPDRAQRRGISGLSTGRLGWVRIDPGHTLAIGPMGMARVYLGCRSTAVISI